VEVAKEQRGPLTAAELEARWAALGGEAAGAYQATLSLALAPRQAVPLLRQRLTGGPAPDAKTVARWLRDLDDEDFDAREAATRELARLGRTVEADLRRARAATPSAEAARRLDALLARLGDRTAEELRGQRAVAALELAATAEAAEALGHLSDKGATEEVRRLAAAALRRLAKRPAP
jgi:hypothetical protein